MSPRMCFRGKIEAGQVSERAGAEILKMLDAFTAEHSTKMGDAAGVRQAAMEAAAIAKGEAARKADMVRGNLIAQANALKVFADFDAKVSELRKTPGDFGWGNKAPPMLGKDQTTLGFAMRSLLARDPFELATWNNVDALAKFVRGEAHRLFAESVEFLRPTNLGFTPQATRELDVLRALFGRTDVDPQARVAAQAWEKTATSLADQFIEAGGTLAKRPQWRLPNPSIDAAKARALGPSRYAQLVRESVDRAQMIDFATKQPLNDARFEKLLAEHVESVMSGSVEGVPSAAPKGGRMLANSRDFSRFIVFKNAEAWTRFAETVGDHGSVFDTMMAHVAGMANDIGMLRVLGPNPDATKQFILGLFDREPGRLKREAPTDEPTALAATAKANASTESRVRWERRVFENAYGEVSGLNKIPVSTGLATTMGNVRAWLSSTQLGGALISSFGDTATLAMAARFNGLPVMNVISRATQMMGEKGSEIFAAQQGVVLDSLAHTIGQADRMSGETIRSGIAAKLASANIRISGLRRWTASLRGAFALEMMAHVAAERGKKLADLDPTFRGALDRYGIGAEDWDVIRGVDAHEPRPGAMFIRPADLVEAGHQAQAEKLSRLTTTEMDYAVIDNDPLTRSLVLGSSQPGTAGGEVRRSVAMYKSFPATFVLMHFARATARGWDASRLGHAALSFAAITALGALSMQSKEILAGRDPLSLDPTTGNGARAWGRAIIQGGGLGVFGDLLSVDQTKTGNTWAATFAGPVASATETLLADFVVKNIQQAGKGHESHFLGDALYAAGRQVPGSSLWFARAAFQGAVLDQLALMADPRTPERFRRFEETSRKEFGQAYWWRRGQAGPSRTPDFNAVLGGR